MVDRLRGQTDRLVNPLADGNKGALYLTSLKDTNNFAYRDRNLLRLSQQQSQCLYFWLTKSNQWRMQIWAPLPSFPPNHYLPPVCVVCGKVMFSVKSVCSQWSPCDHYGPVKTCSLTWGPHSLQHGLLSQAPGPPFSSSYHMRTPWSQPPDLFKLVHLEPLPLLGFVFMVF